MTAGEKRLIGKGSFRGGAGSYHEERLWNKHDHMSLKRRGLTPKTVRDANKARNGNRFM